MDFTHLRPQENVEDSEVPPHSIYNCGICGACHPWDWDGDCREDANRFYDAEDYARRNGLRESQVTEFSMGQRIAYDLGDPDWRMVDEQYEEWERTSGEVDGS